MIELSVKSSSREQLINITSQVEAAVSKSGVTEGICMVYVPHTTAAVTINESADPDVVRDIRMGLGRLVPLSWDYAHSEGNADAHIKSSLIGCSIMLIVEGGRLRLGTWQGIFFCEFDGPRSRRCYVKLIPS